MENESAIVNWVDKFNPFAKKFREVNDYQDEINRQVERNRVGFTTEYSEETSISPDGSPSYSNNAYGFSSAKMSFDLPSESKRQKTFNIDLVQSNYFREYKEMEKMTDRLNLLTIAKDLSVDINNPETKNNPLSRKYILTHPGIFGMSEEEWNANSEMRQQEVLEMDRMEMMGIKSAGGSDEGATGSSGMGSMGMGEPPPETGTAGGEPSTTDEAPVEPETQTASYTKSTSKAMMFIMESTPSIV